MVQVTSTQSWFSRVIGAFVGILIGFALIVGSFILIFWNEGHGLHIAQSLEQTQKIVITVPNSPIDPQNNLRVIHFSGLADTKDILKDNSLDISEKAIKLDRKVEMYQWQENSETSTEKEIGGSEKTVTNYTYQKIWSDKLIDSSQFKEQPGHQNPDNMILKSQVKYAKNVTVGDFKLPEKLIKKISGEEPIDLSNVDTNKLHIQFNKTIQHEGSDLYVGNVQSPQIGDLKISMSEVLPSTVSVIAQQSGNNLQAYVPHAGQPVLLLSMGTQSPQQMILDAQSENTTLMWILRAVSLILMIIGLALLMRPLAVIADVIPFVGSIIGVGTGVIAFIGGLILWALATALALLTVRPLFVIGLVIIVAVICSMIIAKRKAK